MSWNELWEGWMEERSRWRAQQRQRFGGRRKFGAGSPGGTSGKESACQDIREWGLAPGWEDPLEEGMANPFQYSCTDHK